MKIFSSKQIREIDSYTIENEPIKSIDLMERAAKALCIWIRKRFKKETEFLFLIGPGNNGGDGWALARLLFHYGYENIRFYVLNITDSLSPDSELNKQRLVKETTIRIEEISSEEEFPIISDKDWVIDALFGSGLSRPLEGIASQLISHLNASEKSGVIAIDIPSGLFGEDNLINKRESVVKANKTLCFQFPKLAFFFAENAENIGDWYVLPIGLSPEIIELLPADNSYLRKSHLVARIKPRTKFSHKGTYGHSLLIAGSYGMMGAAILAGKAAVKSGTGLLTMHIPKQGYDIVQTSVPEAIVSIDESDLMFTGVHNLQNFSAVGIGPGINKKTNTQRALIELIKNIKVPLVIDADALNILSENKECLINLPGNTILTPHPGEFDRLTRSYDSNYERYLGQIQFSKENNVIVILKGAHTSISIPTGKVWFNSTGNPGMATGGSGDVLTGIILSLLAQNYSPLDAALIGTYIHGMAGDLALKTQGFHSLSPSDIINKLGRAFKKIEQ